MALNPQAVKKESEEIILRAGGQICDWLPHIERKKLRSRDEIVARALVLNAMLQIHFGAPTEVIEDWIERNDLTNSLSPREADILSTDNDELSEQELTDLFWYIEALWALMWVGSLIDEMPFDRPVENFMASLAPNLQINEDGSKFSKKMKIRPYDDIFRMLDLYFRLHWYARNGELTGNSTEPVSHDIIMERRKALEWVLAPDEEWDDIALNT
jgi:hypothetical protein